MSLNFLSQLSLQDQSFFAEAQLEHQIIKLLVEEMGQLLETGVNSMVGEVII